MESIGELIRKLRKEKGYTLQTTADHLGVDTAVLSKMERGQRNITKEQVLRLADLFGYDRDEMLVAYLSDRIVYQVEGEELAMEAIRAAEAKIDYKKFVSLDKKQVLKRIVDVLKRFPGITKAWVYGSFARGDDNPESDIDIAVNADKGFSYFDLAGVQNELEKTLRKKVDIGFIDSFKSYILKNIEPDLKCIYERQA